jgi:hypothetical protein
MDNTSELKALFRVLSKRPRLAIVDAISRSPGIDAASIALAVSQPEYEIEDHLRALHESGVLALEDYGWHVSPKVATEPDGKFLRFEARTRDGSYLEMHFDPKNSL